MISSSVASVCVTCVRTSERMAADASLADSYTDSPSHTGQARRLVMLSTRCSGVRGPLSRVVPTARKPATTNISSTQPGHFFNDDVRLMPRP